jgi:methylmalonyl-CoA mutase N-terminal domain/subunit
LGHAAFRADAETAARQKARLERVRRERDQSRVKAALAKVEEASRRGTNLVEPVLDAVRAYATLGEICDIWRKQFGVFEPSNAY